MLGAKILKTVGLGPPMLGYMTASTSGILYFMNIKTLSLSFDTFII